MKRKNAQKIEAARLVFQGQSFTDAAKAVGVNRNTVAKWAKSEEWSDIQEDLAANARGEAVKKLRGAASLAVDALVRILTDDFTRDADRHKAAVAILDRIGVGAHSYEHTTDETLLTEEQAIKLLQGLGMQKA